MTAMFLKIEHLSKRFSPKLPPALQEIDAEITQGKMIGLIGADGAGKTTLIRLIAGLLLPTTGSITLLGKDTIRDASFIHSSIGYMPQKFGLYEELTVKQNLELYSDLQGVTREERQAVFQRLLQFTGLAPFMDRLARALSGGMKQKLGLACVLVRKPILLLLDEPTVGVDPISRRELWNMIQGLTREGISVIWSTSYLDEAERCFSVLLLQEGRLLYQGPPGQFSKGGDFKSAFLNLLGQGSLGESELAANMPKMKTQHKTTVIAETLTKRFDSFTAVDKISFSIHQGEIFGLLGPNGAGKSTTFKMLCGLLTPTSGTASVNGLNLQDAPALARSQIGYMAQKFSLYGRLTLKQNLEFFAGIYQVDPSAVSKIVKIFHFEPYLDQLTESLPLGLKQRISLACATLHHPLVLFLDEPTSGVDPKMRIEFWNHIQGLVKKGVTVLVTTHFMEEAEYCTRIALIHEGKIIELDTPDALKQKTSSNTLDEAFIKSIENHAIK